jgi:hypothetical protein
MYAPEIRKLLSPALVAASEKEAISRFNCTI